MVWRIHFGDDDLARVQVSPTLGPLAETVLAVGMLRCTQQPRTLLSEWRGQVSVTPRMTPLTALIPTTRSSNSPPRRSIHVKRV